MKTRAINLSKNKIGDYVVMRNGNVAVIHNLVDPAAVSGFPVTLKTLHSNAIGTVTMEGCFGGKENPFDVVNVLGPLTKWVDVQRMASKGGEKLLVGKVVLYKNDSLGTVTSVIDKEGGLCTQPFDKTQKERAHMWLTGWVDERGMLVTKSAFDYDLSGVFLEAGSRPRIGGWARKYLQQLGKDEDMQLGAIVALVRRMVESKDNMSSAQVRVADYHLFELCKALALKEQAAQTPLLTEART